MPPPPPDLDDSPPLTRRRAAAQRLPILPCGCADTWICEIEGDGWPDSFATARAHLAALGYDVDRPAPRQPCRRELVG